MNNMFRGCTDCGPESTSNDSPSKKVAAPSAGSAPDDAISLLTTTTRRIVSEASSAITATPLSASSNSTSPQPNEHSPISDQYVTTCVLGQWNPAHHHRKLCLPTVYGMSYDEWARYGR